MAEHEALAQAVTELLCHFGTQYRFEHLIEALAFEQFKLTPRPIAEVFEIGRGGGHHRKAAVAVTQ